MFTCINGHNKRAVGSIQRSLQYCQLPDKHFACAFIKSHVLARQIQKWCSLLFLLWSWYKINYLFWYIRKTSFIRQLWGEEMVLSKERYNAPCQWLQRTANGSFPASWVTNSNASFCLDGGCIKSVNYGALGNSDSVGTLNTFLRSSVSRKNALAVPISVQLQDVHIAS